MAGPAARCIRLGSPVLYSNTMRICQRIPRAALNHPTWLYSARELSLNNRVFTPCRFIHTSQVLAKKGKGKGKDKGKSSVDTTVSADTSVIDLNQVKQDMEKAVEILRQDFIKTLSIRTSQGSLDHIVVDTPDGKFPLNHLGQIATKSNNMMVVNMSNFPQATDAAAEAIKRSDMNLSPAVDGHTIQVPIPKVTKEHRENLAKSAKKKCNETKVNVRNVRNKHVQTIKKFAKTKSKDIIFKLEQQVQTLMEQSVSKSEDLLAAKTKELLGK